MQTFQRRILIPEGAEPDSTLSRLSALFADRVFVSGMLFVLVIAAFLYLCLAAGWPKFGRAEVFFSECAREMLTGGNLVTPLYHGRPFFDKPILIYWLIIACFKVFGVSHFAARIPSIVAALATVGLTGVIGALAFGSEAGLLSAMALSSSFMFLSFAALSMSDMTLVFFDVLTLSLLFWGSVSPRLRSLIWWLASVSVGLAFLTKGPVGLVLPACAFLIYMGLTRQLRTICLHQVLAGVATTLLLASPWFVAAYQANGAGAIGYFFIHENLQRFAGSAYDTHKPFGFMVSSLTYGFAPWSIFLPMALVASFNKVRGGIVAGKPNPELYLWIWLATVTCFFSSSRGQCDYYVLPAYPAGAALVGGYLAYWIKRRRAPAVFGGWLMALSLLAVGLIVLPYIPNLAIRPGLSHWLIMPVALILSGILSALSLLRRQVLKAYTLVFTGLCLSIMGFGLQMYPGLMKLEPIVRYAEVIKDGPASARVGVDKSLDHWIDNITFDTAREPVRIEDVAQLQAFLLKPSPVYVIVPQSRFQELPSTAIGHTRILGSARWISHSLNPGFVIKSQGRLCNPTPLLLVTNMSR